MKSPVNLYVKPSGVGAVGGALVDLQTWMMRRMDVFAARRGGNETAAHLATGERGEREALFHLRKMGYTVVARRWKSAKLWGDVDLIGWDGEWLCFVEVKTRTARDWAPAESAVDHDKQQMLRRMARAYLRGFPEKLTNGGAGTIRCVVGILAGVWS